MFGLPSAPTGFAGVCQFEFSNSVRQARVTSCTLQNQQEVTSPNNLDIFYDRGVMQNLPEVIEGSIEFPIILEDTALNIDPTPVLYALTTERDSNGRLGSFDTFVKYDNKNTGIRYINSFVNSFSFSVQHESHIMIRIDVQAMDAFDANFARIIPETARLASWYDAIVVIRTPDFVIDNAYIRSFEARINNNLERFFTGGGSRILRVKDISPRHRIIDGNMTIMGRHPALATYSRQNVNRCLNYPTIDFGYRIPCSLLSENFIAHLPNTIYQIEEVSMSNELFETVVKYISLPADNNLVSSL